MCGWNNNLTSRRVVASRREVSEIRFHFPFLYRQNFVSHVLPVPRLLWVSIVVLSTHIRDIFIKREFLSRCYGPAHTTATVRFPLMSSYLLRRFLFWAHPPPHQTSENGSMSRRGKVYKYAREVDVDKWIMNYSWHFDALSRECGAIERAGTACGDIWMSFSERWQFSDRFLPRWHFVIGVIWKFFSITLLQMKV